MPSANSTADRAIEILLMFDDENMSVTASTIAQKFEMPRSTTYRYLSSLRSCGLIVDAGESTYRLGPRIFDLARVARRGYTVLQLAEPELHRLAAATGETVLMTQIAGLEISVLECLESPSPIRISYNRGQVLPTAATASAKVFMAFGDPKKMESIVRRRRLSKHTDHTIVDPDELFRELKRAKEQGFALNRDEVDDGISAVAAPVFGAAQQVRYAVSVAMPSFRVTEEKLKAYAEQVTATAHAISEAIKQF